jgi:hypothetical protein
VPKDRLENLFSRLNIIRVISSRWTICADDVAQMEQTRNSNWILVGTYEGETT